MLDSLNTFNILNKVMGVDSVLKKCSPKHVNNGAHILHIK